MMECALTAGIQDVHNTLAKGGCQPKFHRMDNECPQQVKDYLKKRDVQYQLAPPDDHRSNAAERAIRTAKNHLAAGWYSTDDNFPMYLWDKAIPQAELTLNLLRGSRINPKLSASEQIHGRYDFNAHPIAPPGIKVHNSYFSNRARRHNALICPVLKLRKNLHENPQNNYIVYPSIVTIDDPLPTSGAPLRLALLEGIDCLQLRCVSCLH
jgi:hypothetical protein